MTSTSLWAKLINSAPTKNNKLTVLSPVCKVHTHPSLTEVQGGSGKEHRSPLKECGSAADAPGALPPLPWAASLLEEEMDSSKSIRQHKELFSF